MGHHWVPDALYETETTPIGKLLVAFLCRTVSHKDPNRDYTHFQLAQILGVGERTIRKELNALKLLNMVRWARSRKRWKGSIKGGVPNTYTVQPVTQWDPAVFKRHPMPVAARQPADLQGEPIGPPTDQLTPTVAEAHREGTNRQIRADRAVPDDTTNRHVVPAPGSTTPGTTSPGSTTVGTAGANDAPAVPLPLPLIEWDGEEFLNVKHHVPRWAVMFPGVDVWAEIEEATRYWSRSDILYSGAELRWPGQYLEARLRNRQAEADYVPLDEAIQARAVELMNENPALSADAASRQAERELSEVTEWM